MATEKKKNDLPEKSFVNVCMTMCVLLGYSQKNKYRRSIAVAKIKASGTRKHAKVSAKVYKSKKPNLFNTDTKRVELSDLLGVCGLWK